MKENERIIDQLQRAFKKDSWSGPSLMEVLATVTADSAAARPVVNAHTIWEIVLHIAAWKDVVRHRIEGKLVRVPDEGDWPAVTDTGAAAWQKTLAKLEQRHDELVNVAQSLTDGRLEDILITEHSCETGGGVSCYVTLHGIIQHDLYHAGQIALLKKAWMK
jgi:uncharacterized damage-inducible protein DinB